LTFSAGGSFPLFGMFLLPFPRQFLFPLSTSRGAYHFCLVMCCDLTCCLTLVVVIIVVKYGVVENTVVHARIVQKWRLPQRKTWFYVEMVFVKGKIRICIQHN